MGGCSLEKACLALSGVGVPVMVVGVTLVDVMDMAGTTPVMLVGVALVDVVSVIFGVVLVPIALVTVVDVADLLPVVLMGSALVDVVLLHSLLLGGVGSV